MNQIPFKILFDLKELHGKISTECTRTSVKLCGNSSLLLQLNMRISIIEIKHQVMCCYKVASLKLH